MLSPKVYAVDFESSYATDRDIKSLGVVPYLRHPETHLYLVSIYGDGISYSGPVETAPWHLIDGAHWVSHNAAFDAACYLEAIRRGQVPTLANGTVPYPTEWDCTANLCAFLAAPRSLDKAMMALMHVHVDKSTRDEMKGKQWSEMSPEFKDRVVRYALIDSEKCYQLWSNFSEKWPEIERRLSRHTMAMCLNGIGTDRAYIDDGIVTLTAALWATEQRIPWANTTYDGREVPIMSPNALRRECVRLGIPPPITTADKSEVFDLWMARYEAQAPFVRAVKDYRSINRTLEILKKLRDQTNEDGRLRYSLKYFGAHTGRWSGDAGLNFHNFPKAKFYFDAQHNRIEKPGKDETPAAFVVDIRGCLVPAAGKKFVVADLSQIEARVALWLADDKAQLDLIRSGMDLYEAHARSKMGYKFSRALKDYCDDPSTPEKDKNIRQFAKCRVLGLGFGLGFKKFVIIVMQWAGIVITEREAKQIVDDFRASNPGIVAIWTRLDRAMRRHAAGPKRAEPFEIELPSWRKLSYFNVNEADGLRAQDEMGGHLLYFYGGKLFENLVQATARDILAEAILRIEDAGHSVVLHVHDEVVCEVDMDVSKEVIEALMEFTPEWAPGLPVACDAKEVMRYFK